MTYLRSYPKDCRVSSGTTETGNWEPTRRELPRMKSAAGMARFPSGITLKTASLLHSPQAIIRQSARISTTTPGATEESSG